MLTVNIPHTSRPSSPGLLTPIKFDLPSPGAQTPDVSDGRNGHQWRLYGMHKPRPGTPLAGQHRQDFNATRDLLGTVDYAKGEVLLDGNHVHDLLNAHHLYPLLAETTVSNALLVEYRPHPNANHPQGHPPILHTDFDVYLHGHCDVKIIKYESTSDQPYHPHANPPQPTAKIETVIMTDFQCASRVAAIELKKLIVNRGKVYLGAHAASSGVHLRFFTDGFGTHQEVLSDPAIRSTLPHVWIQRDEQPQLARHFQGQGYWHH